jgi:hypothetical protein
MAKTNKTATSTTFKAKSKKNNKGVHSKSNKPAKKYKGQGKRR